uniref:LO8 n=1 Tax=Havana anole adomavirus TaxID=2609869 RepID=A0A6F9F3N9_9VIRU|nr:TPA_asm: LO8 [Havana anole adomavirus]
MALSFSGPSRPVIASQMPFLSWGWLSIDEFLRTTRSLRVMTDLKVSLLTLPMYSTMPTPRNGTSNICLMQGHYVCVSHINNRLIFFDPLGSPSHRFFSNANAIDHIDMNIKVQSDQSVYCGNFCLLFAYIVFFDIHKRWAKNTQLYRLHIIQAVQRYLNIAPEDLTHNEFLVEMFTIDWKLGEEFTNPHYPKLYAYSTRLSKESV